MPRQLVAFDMVIMVALFEQRLVSGVLDANSKEWSLREVVVMLSMIGVLARQLEAGSVQVGVALR